MSRKEFLQNSLLMGIGLPFLTSYLLKNNFEKYSIFSKTNKNFKGKITIIGAGAAGLAAGYTLKHQNIDFEILEAAPVYGGRLKKADGFADFPLDLGAEWIHTEPSILNQILHKSILDKQFETIDYNPQNIQTWKKGKLRSRNYIKSLYSEWKFKRSTWFDFFEQNIIPEISDKVKVNTTVNAINYSKYKIEILTNSNKTVIADKVLITVPVKILQSNLIKFYPELPHDKQEAANKVFMGDGIKIFIEFKEKFYPDILSFGNIFKAISDEEKFVYDAAFKKDTKKHILGLFAINSKALAYTNLENEDQIIAQFLNELDYMFNGQATKYYLRHIIQNWSKEPYIQGAYSYTFDGRRRKIVEAISKPVSDKIYFAGEALSIDHQATVHGACETAYNTIVQMINK